MKSACVAILLSFCALTNAAPSQPDKPSPPAAAKAKPSYSLAEGYFVKNTHPIPASGISCLWFETQADFDQVLQKTPPLMYSQPTKPVSLNDAIAVAIIHQGTTVPEMKVTSVTVQGNVLVVEYTSKTPPAAGTATFAVPLVLVVPKASLKGVQAVSFIENGREAGSAQRPGKQN